ncbi:MAG: amino acid ABC transporter substrate-binding protein [Xenococcaceae cyanobacterium]
MNKKLAITLLSLIFLAGFPISTWAETVLERVERTGVMNAGARKEAIPFGYVGINNEWTGYSIDLLKLIHRQLEQRLNKPIKLNLREVTIDNRFQLVQDETLDVMCGATTITQERLQWIDFSIPFFMTGTQFLVRKEAASQFNYNGGLVNVPIAYIPGTTTDQIIRQIYPQANWQSVRNRPEGLQKLKRREVQAVASDGILLVGELVRQGNNPRNFTVVPLQPMTTELYGCMLQKNNSQWKEFVDNIIISEENRQLQERWFNIETGRFPYLFRLFR